MEAAPRRIIKGRVAKALTLAAVVVLTTAGAVFGRGSGSAADIRPSNASAAEDPVIVAAGDIACANFFPEYNGGEGTATECRQKHTSDLILGADHVFLLGDIQYPRGSLSQYQAVYEATWGRMKSVTFPTPGDHDYQSGGAGYFTYFGVEPYYSFDIGSWHWVSLNALIDHSSGSPQLQWLEQDLAGTTQPCIGAFWGEATFTSGRNKGDNLSFIPFWEALYAARADLILAGDTHNYERFAKQSPAGTAAADGIRQFVVGTGGRSLEGFSTVQPNSEARGKAFGVLQLRLGSGDYSWEFLPEPAGAFTDSGTDYCNA